MAKIMARIHEGIVTNVIACNDSAEETDVLKDIGDVPAGIEDTYSNGKYYRNGELLMSDAEQLILVTADRDKCLADMQELIDEVLGG